MSLIVEKDEPFDPMDLAVFCLGTVMPRANRQPHLVEQFRLLTRRRWRNFGIQPAVNHSERAVYWPIRVDGIHSDSPCISDRSDDVIERPCRRGGTEAK